MGFDIQELKRQLKNPDAIMRTAPLWVWNDEMTDVQIDKMLDELKAHGFGGAIVHPRPGMVIPYLSDEWFRQWGYALAGAKKREMKLYIYDENSYPSGFGGGHVSAELPDCLATSVKYSLIHKEQLHISTKKEKWFGNNRKVCVFACEKYADTHIRLLKEISDIPMEQWQEISEWYAVMDFVPPKTEGWLAGFANVDLCRREVTDMFIKKVYEPYYEHFGEEFGKAIPAIFMDEPALTGSMIYGGGGGNVLPYSYWFSHEFYKRNGYRLEEYLPALFVNTEADWFVHSDKKVRYDYYSTARELWVQNFVMPLSEWCKEHNIALTGHYMEDDWPRAGAQTTSPDVMANFEFMGWPAIDMLVNNKLLTQPNELVGLIMQEVRSVTNQFGQERCFCEAFGAGGWDSTLPDIRRVGDWLMVNGINFINEHLSYQSYLGARKRDHPQSFDWREPWWDEFTGINDYFGRCCAMLSQGKMEQRILVLHPTSTGYMRVQDDEPSNLVVSHVMATYPDMSGYLETLQKLTDDQWDFDLGSEDILRRHGKAENGRIILKRQNYQLIIITKEMENLFSSTAELLENYMKQGGYVLSVGTPGLYVDGVENPGVIKSLEENSHWIKVEAVSELSGKIGEMLPNRMKYRKPFATGVEHMRRVLDDGYELYFFMNHSMQKAENTISVLGNEVTFVDCEKGKLYSYPCRADNGNVTFELSLERYETILLLVSREKLETEGVYQKPDIEGREGLVPEILEIKPEGKNTLLIEYCDLVLDGKCYEDISAMEAGREIFRHRGFSNNPWDNEVQYKDRYLAVNHYGEGSGFTAEYSFWVEKVPKAAEVVVEQGESYQVFVNGHEIILRETDFLDEKNRAADISAYLTVGKNKVTLVNKVFDIRLELEPIYIRGEFAVWNREGIWTIGEQQPLSMGTWVKQGYPMYEGGVRYRYRYNKKENRRVVIQVPQMETTCATLLVGDYETAIVGAGGKYVFEIPSEVLGCGIIEVRVCAGFKNLLGPHHCGEKPRRTAWPDMWRKSPKYGRPRAEEYDLIPYGMTEHIKIYENRE